MRRLIDLWERMAALLFPQPGAADPAADRASYERLAVPFTFKPRLSFFEAVVAVFAALLRIFLGCILFAVWGSYSLFAWSNIPNVFLRWAVLLPMFVLFLFALGLLFLAIAAMVRGLTSHQPSLPK
jgi:hypothetical protein